jgi:hypothetical protein
MTLITPAPPAPDRTDPATFADKADTFVAWMGTLATELNAGALWVAPVGTVGAPSFRSDDDPNTGLNLLGSDQLQLVTNAVARVLLNTTEFQLNLPMTGTAVVSSDTDVTAGRLLKTVPGPAQAFRRGNVIGTVSQSSSIPTGALIERGNNANGTFFRFAGGLQVCFFTVSTDSSGLGPWTFPAVFSSGPRCLGLAIAASDDRGVTVNTSSTTTVTFRGWTTIGNAWEGTLSAVAVGLWH